MVVKPHDSLAKDVLRLLLARSNAVLVQHEVRHEPQFIDVYSAPLLRGGAGRRARVAQFAAIGWLAQMAAETSCFEAQSSALRRSQLGHARRRQWAAWHELQRTERASLPPMLWIVAAEDSPRLVRLFELREHARWPTGFRFAVPGERWCLVVVPQLPVERATLPLRALGRGAVHRNALLELNALPHNDPMRAPLASACRRQLLALSLDESEADMEPENLDVLRMVVDNYEREIHQKGLREGRKEGHKQGGVAALRKAVAATLSARGLVLTAAGAARLRACDDEPTLLRWVGQAATAATGDAVFADPE